MTLHLQSWFCWIEDERYYQVHTELVKNGWRWARIHQHQGCSSLLCPPVNPLQVPCAHGGFRAQASNDAFSHPWRTQKQPQATNNKKPTRNTSKQTSSVPVQSRHINPSHNDIAQLKDIQKKYKMCRLWRDAEAYAWISKMSTLS